MFKERLISGIILVAAALVLILTGGNVLLLGLGIVSLIGLYELYNIFQIEKSLLGCIGYIVTIVYYINLQYTLIDDIMLFILIFFILIVVAYVISFPKYKTEQLLITFFGFFYVSVMLSCIYSTRMLSGGAYFVWLIFLCSWGSDTCAYCVGVLFGKHKLAPKLSPKKSVEGAIGGLAGTVILTIIYGLIFYREMNIDKNYIVVLAGICGVGAIISMIGDLAASAIKRNYNIKDFGTLIPGHGGILDRFDSVIFTAPVIYYLSLYIQ